MNARNLITRRTSITLLLAALVSSLPAAAASHSVCASGCDYTLIQDAIDGASAGDTLELDPETFLEGDISVNKNLTIKASSGQPVVDADGDDFAFTVSSGKIVRFEDLKLQGATRAMLRNFGITTLSTVYVIGDGSNTDFGGILNTGSSASLTIKDNSLIANNSSAGLGGGITNYADLVIQNTTVTANEGHRGGGVFNWKGIVSISTSSFSFNHATVRGGAWYNGHASGTVAFLSSASTSVNTADVDCDKYKDVSGSPSCVN